MNTKTYTTAEVARIFGVAAITVKSWRMPSHEGAPLRLIGQRITYNRYQYTLSDLERFARENEKYLMRYLRHLSHILKEQSPNEQHARDHQTQAAD